MGEEEKPENQPPHPNTNLNSNPGPNPNPDPSQAPEPQSAAATLETEKETGKDMARASSSLAPNPSWFTPKRSTFEVFLGFTGSTFDAIMII